MGSSQNIWTLILPLVPKSDLEHLSYFWYGHHYKLRCILILYKPISRSKTFLRSFFQKILALCMVSIQHWFISKSGYDGAHKIAFLHYFFHMPVAKWCVAELLGYKFPSLLLTNLALLRMMPALKLGKSISKVWVGPNRPTA